MIRMKNLPDILKSMNKTQKALAKQARISERKLSAYIHEKDKPTLDELKRIETTLFDFIISDGHKSDKNLFLLWRKSFHLHDIKFQYQAFAYGFAAALACKNFVSNGIFQFTPEEVLSKYSIFECSNMIEGFLVDGEKND